MQELLRHATVKMTPEVYTQAVTPAKRKAQSKVAGMLQAGAGAKWWTINRGAAVPGNKSDILQGTLDLMVLKTLESIGPLTRSGRKQIEQETENWERIAATMARFLASSN